MHHSCRYAFVLRSGNELGFEGKEGRVRPEAYIAGPGRVLDGVRQIIQSVHSARQLPTDALRHAKAHVVQDVPGRPDAVGSRDGALQTSRGTAADPARQKPGALPAATSTRHSVRLMNHDS